MICVFVWKLSFRKQLDQLGATKRHSQKGTTRYLTRGRHPANPSKLSVPQGNQFTYIQNFNFASP